MVKSDKDHAHQLWEMASKDHLALTNMRDVQSFAEEIFGFHAQQVIEKGLKAWIAVRRLTYPKSHDVGVLVRILETAGEDLSRFSDLEDYTIFAVQYRYEAYDDAEERLHRDGVISRTGTFLSHVRRIIEGAQ
jgi:HEPN domain-containing protein